MKQRRNTKQRQLILEAVKARPDHPVADEIYQAVRALDPKISRSTVYRNLRLLAEDGELRSVQIPEADRFDYRLERHHHLLCSRCGAVSDAPLAYQPQFDLLAAQSGYQVEGHYIVFVGLCPKCQGKDNNQ